MQQELASRDAVQLIPQPLADAQPGQGGRGQAGKATFADQLTLLLALCPQPAMAARR